MARLYWYLSFLCLGCISWYPVNRDLLLCGNCQTTKAAQAHLNLCDRKAVPILNLDIILYRDPHPLSEEITQKVAKNIKAADLLLVVGTSMKVDRIQNVIWPFTQAVTCRLTEKKKLLLYYLLQYISTWISPTKPDGSILFNVG